MYHTKCILQMHIVTYNRERYDDASQAIASGDGNALAVFGILFTVSVYLLLIATLIHYYVIHKKVTVLGFMFA